MNELIFWKNWRTAAKILLFIICIPLFAALSAYAAAVIGGNKWALDWEVETQAEKLGVPIEHFQEGIFNFTIETDAYVLQESFLGTDISLTNWPAYVLLAVFAFTLIVALSVVISMNRFGYAGTMSLFVFLLASLKTEQLMFLGSANHTLLGMMLALYLGASLYFYFFRQDISLGYRLLTFSVITAVCASLIAWGSEVNHPFLYLVSFGMPALLLLSVLSIILVAPEIIRGLLYITSSGTIGKKGSNVRHFLLISLFYLVNLLVIYLHNNRTIDWDIFYISEFFILFISLLIGFWGYYKKAEITGGALPYQPLGAYLYLALSALCLSTIAYTFFTVNDPLIEMFEDTIVFSHLGLGVSFLLYCIINFYDMLHHNAPVHKVLYKPKRMPLFVSNLFGVILTLGLLFQSNMYAYHQSKSGYFNGIGDLYLKEKELFLAEQYYKEGRAYDFQNHRSNYSIATLARNQNDAATALYYFKESFKKNATPQAYVNAARFYDGLGMFFDALFTLRKGAKEFPDNAPILNNLAFLYAKTEMVDSALYYLEKGMALSSFEENTQTNLAAIVANSHVKLNPDSIAEVFAEREYPPLKSNLAVQLSQQSYELEAQPWPEFIKGEALNFYEFTYIYDYTFNQLLKGDTTLTRKIREFRDAPGNDSYREELTLLAALAHYYAGQTADAFELLRGLAQSSVRQPQYYYELLGKLALKKDNPLLAAEFFGYAAQLKVQDAPLNKAIALTYAGKEQQAQQAWKQVGSQHEQIAHLMQKLISEGDAFDLKGKSDAVRLEYVRLQLRKENWKVAHESIRGIQDPNYKAQALYTAVNKATQAENTSMARSFLEDLKQSATSEEWKPKVSVAELRVLAAENNKEALNRRLKEEASNSYLTLTERNLYELMADDQMEEAQKIRLVEQLTRDPFNEQGILAASEYYNSRPDGKEKAYDILVKATQLNPYSVRIKQAYILQSIDMGLERYAQDAFRELQSLATAEQLEIFEPQYKKAMIQKSKTAGGW